MGEEIPASLVDSLTATALHLRRDIVRRTYAAGSGPPGGSLSVADLVTALVFHEMRFDPARPDWPERDRLILSKGHAAPVLYAALAEKGFLPRPETPDPGGRRLPLLEASTGSLGQGIGIAVGMALDARLAGRANRVFAILGDGECQEGSTWEALMAGGHYRLHPLTVILDRNGAELDGPTESIMGIEPIGDKFRAFRYHTLEIDGHDFPAILGALAEAKRFVDGPTAIIARTVKGKGVSFLERPSAGHGKPLTKAEAEKALAELGTSLEAPSP
jgi:transketolase